jgi:hypothetical protein
MAKRAFPADNNLNKMVEQHSAGHRQNECEQPEPVFPQDEGEERRCGYGRYPEGRGGVAQGEHPVDQGLGQMSMEPSCDLMIHTRNRAAGNELKSKRRRQHKPGEFSVS